MGPITRGRKYGEIWVFFTREKFGENQRIFEKMHKIKLVLLETVPSMETFSRPEQGSDRLFQKRASNGK